MLKNKVEKGLNAIDDIIDYFVEHEIDTDEAISILMSLLKPLYDCKRLGVLLLNREKRRKK